MNSEFLHPAHLLIYLSVFISIAGAYPYIRDTLRGQTKPNRVSWGMWTLAPLIGTGAAISAGGDLWTVVRVFLAGFIPLLVFTSSFVNRNSYWKITSFDLWCGFASLIALVLWLAMNNPVMAILFAVIGDALAAIPTLRKAWQAPETETATTYAASALSVLLIVPSIPAWDIPNVAFPLYLLIVDSLLMTFIWRGKIFEKKCARR
jgi:hypothetical protein